MEWTKHIYIFTMMLPLCLVAKKDITGIVSEGDIMIGGVFPVHTIGVGERSCGSLNKERGIQRLEAMRFALIEINANQSLLKGLKLGSMILDTCSDPTHSLDQSLEFVMSTLTVSQPDQCPAEVSSESQQVNRPIVAVIGAAFSKVSLHIANLLRLFQIPQISYASTSAELSNKERFGYFMRTVPPDKLQAEAFANIVNHLNWTYVSTVASMGDYGESGIDSFKRQYEATGQCIATELKVPSEPTRSDFVKIVQELYKAKAGTHSKAKVVILFVGVDDATGILSAATSLGYFHDFIWVASDGWGNSKKPVSNNEKAAQGALTITLKSQDVKKFDEYFLGLTPKNNLKNVWFQKYWEKNYNCSFLPNLEKAGHRVCTGNEREREGDKDYEQEAKIQFVYDAVYALAFALDRLYKEICGENAKKICEEMTFNTTMRTKLMRYIKENKKDDPHGNKIRFDDKGDSLGFYDIMNYQRTDSKSYGYVQIGSWSNHKLEMDLEKVQWPGTALPAGGVPMSICSVECDLGWWKDMTDEHQCCWKCEKCEDNEFLLDEFTCQVCPEGEWPLSNMTGCYTLELEYVRWDSPFAIIPTVFSIIGLICIAFTAVIFIRHAETPVVKAAGRELSFMVLIGCALCYIGVFILLVKPSTISCVAQRFFIGAGFSVVYSALFTKTNRIYRIFASASKTTKRPPYISPKSQVVIASLLSAVQIIVFAAWLGLENPGIRREVPFSNRKSYVVLKCNFKELSLLLSLIYNMALIIVCTIHAVFARNIPSDFNESKFIGFTMYTTCIIWLSFCPVYFGLQSSYKIQVTTLCSAIILSATVALVCLFAPKVYIILFKPEKNRRKTTTDRQRFSSLMKSQYTRQDSETTGYSPNRSRASSVTNNTQHNCNNNTKRKNYQVKDSAIPEEESLIPAERSMKEAAVVPQDHELPLINGDTDSCATAAVPAAVPLHYSCDFTNSLQSDCLSIHSSTSVHVADASNISVHSDQLELYSLKEGSVVARSAQSLDRISRDTANTGIPVDDKMPLTPIISTRYTNGDSGIAIYITDDDQQKTLSTSQSNTWDDSQSDGTELPERLI